MREARPDQRAVETDTQGDRIAAAWYGGSFSIDVNLSDSNTHQIALYLLDWDRQGRGETVTVHELQFGRSAGFAVHSRTRFQFARLHQYDRRQTSGMAPT